MKNMQPTNPLTKKRKKKHLEVAQALPTVNSYHPEDECIQKVCPFLDNREYRYMAVPSNLCATNMMLSLPTDRPLHE